MVDPDELGGPRFEFRPLPASPILIALFMLTLFVVLVGLPLSSLSRGTLDLWWLWIVPPLLLLGAMVLGRPAPFRVYDNGVELPLPLWRRLAGARRIVGVEEIINLYPRLYYVAGALLSPFAASVGTVEHLGLNLDLADGREIVVKFTPGNPRFAQGQEEGYTLAAEELRAVFREHGRPWVSRVRDYAPDEIDRMKRAAARPLMPFTVIVLAFFAPVALIPLLHAAFTALEIPLNTAGMAILVAAGVAPVLAMLLTSWRRSRVRHGYLKEIAKHREWKREARGARAT